MNLFHATGLFLLPLETLQNLWFSNVLGRIDRDQYYEIFQILKNPI